LSSQHATEGSEVRAGAPIRTRRPGRVRGSDGRRGEDSLTAFLGGVRDYAIFMLDRHGHVLSWTPAAQAINGYKPEAVVGRHHSIFYTPEG